MVFVWGVARAVGAEVLLRMEDHDRTRCRPEYEAGILEDLAWLGFAPDVGAPAAFRAGACAYRQSDCGPAYAAALADLKARGLVYACDCSRRVVAARTGGAARYDGHCRARGLPLDASDTALRVRLRGAGAAPYDLLGGTGEDDGAFVDPVLRDRHGCWTYHFAVVLDDFLQGVDCVVRGADLWSATPLQVALGEALGRTSPPRYAHHRLIANEAGQKLSKRDFARPLRDLRAEGQSPESVLGEAAWRVGLQEAARPLAATEAAERVANLVRGNERLEAWLAGGGAA